jgi:hypothetical protein
MSRGVFCIIPNKDYMNDAYTSIESVRRTNPDLNVAAVVEEDIVDDEWMDEYIDEVIEPIYVSELDVEAKYDSDRIEKVFNIDRAPFDRCVYLDADTYVAGDISDMFDALDRFDIMSGHSPHRTANPNEDVPDCFPDHLGGTVGFVNNDELDEFFTEWQRLYTMEMEGDRPTRHKEGAVRIHDQGAFRKALYESDLRLMTLPPEWTFIVQVPGFVRGEVKILHSREDDFQRFADEMNKTDAPRVYVNGPGRHMIDNHQKKLSLPPSTTERLQKSLNRRGVLGTVKLALKRTLG